MKSHALVLAVVLAGCGGPKTVPASALSMAPTERVADLAAEQEGVRQAEYNREGAKQQLMNSEAQLTQARKAAKQMQVQLDETRGARAAAISAGDATTAGELADDLSSVQERQLERDARVARLERQVALDKAQLEKAERFVELQAAELEYARATAAVAGGAEMKLKRYEKQLEKAQSHHQDAVATVDDLEDMP